MMNFSNFFFRECITHINISHSSNLYSFLRHNIPTRA